MAVTPPYPTTAPDLMRPGQRLPAGQTVVGVGVDVIEIDLFRQRTVSSHPAFYALVFTEGERSYCQSCADPAPHFAARFAAKEAAVKALSGSLPVAVPQVEVRRDCESGKPALHLVSRRGEAVPACNHIELLVSLAHGTDFATAFVVAVSDQPAVVPEMREGA